MARKSLGFVPLVWECPSCGTVNPGPIKSCTSCGAPQPEEVDFLQVDEEKFNFIKDEALIRMAKAGPDIHCPYCSTLNPATHEHCSNCGGDLSLGGKARQAGQRVQSVQRTLCRVNQPSHASTEIHSAPVHPAGWVSARCLPGGSLFPVRKGRYGLRDGHVGGLGTQHPD